MKAKQIWMGVALFLITAIAVVTGWSWKTVLPSAKIVPTNFHQSVQPGAPTQRPAASAPSNFQALEMAAPLINGDQLWADVEALASRRYTESERNQARSYILESLQAAGWTPQIQRFEQGINIVAERPGTDPTAGTILVGAHYDTVERSPGADDNASGVAAALEVARAFGDRPTLRTLQLVFFDGEEVGLLGSLAFTAEANNIASLKGSIILEMLGYACHTSGCQHYPVGLPITPPSDRGNFLAVIGDQNHQPLINAFHQAHAVDLPEVFSLAIPLLGMFTPDVLRSDHAPFWQKGIGAVMVTDTANFRTPHYHRSTDTSATLDRPFFAGTTQIVVNATHTLLNSAESLASEANHFSSPAADSLPTISF